MDHVNNAVYLDWAEEAIRAADRGRPRRLEHVPRRWRLEYLGPAERAHPVLASAWTDGAGWSCRIVDGTTGEAFVGAQAGGLTGSARPRSGPQPTPWCVRATSTAPPANQPSRTRTKVRSAVWAVRRRTTPTAVRYHRSASPAGPSSLWPRTGPRPSIAEKSRSAPEPTGTASSFVHLGECRSQVTITDGTGLLLAVLGDRPRSGRLLGTAGYAATIGRRQMRRILELTDRLATATDLTASVDTGKVDDARLRAGFGRLAERMGQAWTLATVDLLTGALNRQALLARLEEELDRAARYQRPCSIVLVDLDHFKRVNDTHGHMAGDAVLREVAERPDQPTSASVDLVGRYGGEEFMIVMPETDADAAAASAEKLRRLVGSRQVRLEDGHVLAVTLSAGVAGGLGQFLQLDALVRDADAALYSAKSLGRDQVYVFHEIEEGSSHPSRRDRPPGPRAGGRGRPSRDGRGDGSPPGRAVARPAWAGKPSNMIAEMAVSLARALDLPSGEVERVRTASLLHDLGKLAIPDEILTNPGELDRSGVAGRRRSTRRSARSSSSRPVPCATRRRSSSTITSGSTAGAIPTACPARRSRSAPASWPSPTLTRRWSPDARTGARSATTWRSPSFAATPASSSTPSSSACSASCSRRAFPGCPTSTISSTFTRTSRIPARTARSTTTSTTAGGAPPPIWPMRVTSPPPQGRSSPVRATMARPSTTQPGRPADDGSPDADGSGPPPARPDNRA